MHIKRSTCINFSSRHILFWSAVLLSRIILFSQARVCLNIRLHGACHLKMHYIHVFPRMAEYVIRVMLKKNYINARAFLFFYLNHKKKNKKFDAVQSCPGRQRRRRRSRIFRFPRLCDAVNFLDEFQILIDWLRGTSVVRAILNFLRDLHNKNDVRFDIISLLWQALINPSPWNFSYILHARISAPNCDMSRGLMDQSYEDARVALEYRPSTRPF